MTKTEKAGDHLASASNLLELPTLPFQGLRLLLHLGRGLVHQVAETREGGGEFLLHLVLIRVSSRNLNHWQKVK